MKLPNCEPWRVCSDDDMRRSLSALHLDKDKARLEVTNGKAMVCLPLDAECLEGDTSGFVTVEACKLAMKGRGVLQGAIQANGEQRVIHNQVTLPRPTTESEGYTRFPDLDSVTPDPKEYDVILGVDAELLYNVARAMIAKDKPMQLIIKLRLDNVESAREVKKAMYVEAFNPAANGSYGVVMPCNVKR